MKPKLLLCLALVLSGGLFGCKSISDSHVDVQRQQLTNLYQDKTRPMAERVTAFDNLLETFKAGTRETVLDKYVASDFQSRITPDEPFFDLHLKAPDGSNRWIRLKGEFPADQIVAY